MRDAFWSMLEQYTADMEEGYYYRALNHLWRYIHQVNAYFHALEPWKITDKERFNEILSATCHSLYGIGVLLHPVMPSKMTTMLTSLGITIDSKSDVIGELSTNPWTKVFMLNKIPTLFQKYETEKQGEAQHVPPVRRPLCGVCGRALKAVSSAQTL